MKDRLKAFYICCPTKSYFWLLSFPLIGITKSTLATSKNSHANHVSTKSISAYFFWIKVSKMDKKKSPVYILKFIVSIVSGPFLSCTQIWQNSLKNLSQMCFKACCTNLYLNLGSKLVESPLGGIWYESS